MPCWRPLSTRIGHCRCTGLQKGEGHSQISRFLPVESAVALPHRGRRQKRNDDEDRHHRTCFHAGFTPSRPLCCHKFNHIPREGESVDAGLAVLFPHMLQADNREPRRSVSEAPASELSDADGERGQFFGLALPRWKHNAPAVWWECGCRFQLARGSRERRLLLERVRGKKFVPRDSSRPSAVVCDFLISEFLYPATSRNAAPEREMRVSCCCNFATDVMRR